MSEPEINVDLSKETLFLRICGVCRAITLKKDEDAHTAYHRNRGDTA